ncbi:GNAT family N-acetyltransferase [Colidextribacter sp. OB.20]|uniref:GNAT family N-acetyltransferase n=1 Tax=Colidextribacter sp. OB.20 TaxID=2304568 RepID=UPI00136D638C|nr:GNAT family N-acetyltransferase [Colidextribacter sp. OB.20]NBI09385.1 GNAT family N-acetyltransferase [Colidextribacter sp. OB.20]
MCVTIIPAYEHPLEIGSLFSEYTQALIAGEPSFSGYLSLQNYEEEVRHLEQKYGPPWGRLYLALCDGEPAGCVGLRRMDEQNCEMKRLYVRPQYRDKHIGGRLVQRVIADARTIGYSHMLLDTLPFLDSAIRMYRALGFCEIERYNDNPIDSCIYMKLDL